MLKINILENIEGTWFTYPENEDLKFKIRSLTSKALNNIKKEFTKKEIKFNKKTHEKEMFESVTDEEAYEDALIDYIIEDFEGIIAENNKKAPVTIEYKKAIVEYPKLKTFVMECSQELPTIEAEELNKEIKN